MERRSITAEEWKAGWKVVLAAPFFVADTVGSIIAGLLIFSLLPYPVWQVCEMPDKAPANAAIAHL